MKDKNAPFQIFCTRKCVGLQINFVVKKNNWQFRVKSKRLQRQLTLVILESYMVVLLKLERIILLWSSCSKIYPFRGYTKSLKYIFHYFHKVFFYHIKFEMWTNNRRIKTSFMLNWIRYLCMLCIHKVQNFFFHPYYI
jgi:hypothetical protein